MFTRAKRREGRKTLRVDTFMRGIARRLFCSWEEYADYLNRHRQVLKNGKEELPRLTNLIETADNHELCLAHLTQLIFSKCDYAAAYDYVVERERAGHYVLSVPNGAVSLALTLDRAGLITIDKDKDPFGSSELFAFLKSFLQTMLALADDMATREQTEEALRLALCVALPPPAFIALSIPSRRRSHKQRHLQGRFIVSISQPGYRRHPASIAERRYRTDQRRTAIG